VFFLFFPFVNEYDELGWRMMEERKRNEGYE